LGSGGDRFAMEEQDFQVGSERSDRIEPHADALEPTRHAPGKVLRELRRDEENAHHFTGSGRSSSGVGCLVADRASSVPRTKVMKASTGTAPARRSPRAEGFDDLRERVELDLGIEMLHDVLAGASTYLCTFLGGSRGGIDHGSGKGADVGGGDQPTQVRAADEPRAPPHPG